VKDIETYDSVTITLKCVWKNFNIAVFLVTRVSLSVSV